MALESVDCFLSGISAMVVWWGELEGYVLLRQEFLKGCGTFVITLLEDGGEAAAFKVSVDARVRVDEVLGGLRLEWFGHDGIWILDKCHHDVTAAFAGGNGKPTSLIGRNFVD